MNPGTYRARAHGEGAELSTSSNKGTPQVVVPFALEGGETISWVGFLTDAALPFTVKSLRIAGWQGDDFFDLTSLGSKECELVIADEEYNGEVRSRVQYINEIGGGPKIGKSMSEADRKEFARKMRGKVIACGGGKASAAPKPAPKPQDSENPAPVDANGHPLPF